jgi:hypothetical protein
MQPWYPKVGKMPSAIAVCGSWASQRGWRAFGWEVENVVDQLILPPCYLVRV